MIFPRPHAGELMFIVGSTREQMSFRRGGPPCNLIIFVQIPPMCSWPRQLTQTATISVYFTVLRVVTADKSYVTCYHRKGQRFGFPISFGPPEPICYLKIVLFSNTINLNDFISFQLTVLLPQLKMCVLFVSMKDFDPYFYKDISSLADFEEDKAFFKYIKQVVNPSSQRTNLS